MSSCKLCGCDDDGVVYVKVLRSIKEFTADDRLLICHACASALIKMKVVEKSSTPCPFCGDDDITTHCHNNEKYYTYCNWCGARGPIGENEQLTRQAWDHRY